MKFVKKPIQIEAVQFDLNNLFAAANFVGENIIKPTFEDGEPGLVINTNTGPATVRLNDWIIKGVEGEFYPCPESVFEATYDKVDTGEEPANDEWEVIISLLKTMRKKATTTEPIIKAPEGDEPYSRGPEMIEIKLDGSNGDVLKELIRNAKGGSVVAVPAGIKGHALGSIVAEALKDREAKSSASE